MGNPKRGTGGMGGTGGAAFWMHPPSTNKIAVFLDLVFHIVVIIHVVVICVVIVVTHVVVIQVGVVVHTCRRQHISLINNM